MKKPLRQIWAPPEFRKLIKEKQAENLDKTVPDILEDIAKSEREKMKKQRGFSYF